MICASVVKVLVPEPPSLLLWLLRTTPTTAPVTASADGALKTHRHVKPKLWYISISMSIKSNGIITNVSVLDVYLRHLPTIFIAGTNLQLEKE